MRRKIMYAGKLIKDIQKKIFNLKPVLLQAIKIYIHVPTYSLPTAFLKLRYHLSRFFKMKPSDDIIQFLHR